MSNKPSCFVMMPISTPISLLDSYNNDPEHFVHVYELLFVPALKKAGCEPISPISIGAEIIHADIIANISTSDYVLCDMSSLNPNVFFELGVRSSLDKPAILVVDELVTSVPFDISIINYYRYNSALRSWELREQIDNLAKHIENCKKRNDNRNALWKIFSITYKGNFNVKDISNNDKVDFLIDEIKSLKKMMTTDYHYMEIDENQTNITEVKIPGFKFDTDFQKNYKDNDLDDIATHQQFIQDLFRKLDGVLKNSEIIISLYRDVIKLGKHLPEKEFRSKEDIVLLISWILRFSSASGIDLKNAILKRYPGLCPFCLEKTCICHITHKLPNRKLEPNEITQEIYFNYENLMFINENKFGFDNAVKLIKEIFIFKEAIQNGKGYSYLIENLNIEISDIYSATLGHLKLDEEIADVFAWLLFTWGITFPNVSLDKFFKSYHNIGCPVCLQSPCKCEISVHMEHY